MVEHLTSALKAVLEKKDDLNAVISALESAAPTREERNAESGTIDSYKDLVKKYRESACSLSKAKKSTKPKSTSATPFFSLNFAKYRRNLKGYTKSTPNTQVIGFTDTDTHHDVLIKGARGLGIKFNCSVNELSILCSGGLVPDIPINNEPWTLGEYIKLNGGSVNRSKKCWGIYVPIGVEENLKVVDSSTLDSGVSSHGSTFDRKRSNITLSTSKKRRAMSDTGATKEIPVHITSSSDGSEDSDPIEIGVEDVVVKYGLMVDDHLSMSIVAVGRVGVWRVTHMETIDSDQRVLEDISKQMEPFQPEEHSFIVVEIYKGGPALTYLRADVDVGVSCDVKDLKFHVLERRVIRSHRQQKISSTDDFATLLVLSPRHGLVTYTWQKKGDWAWEVIDIPSTCVLYVNSTGMYRCTVENDCYHFQVIGPGEEGGKHDDLLVDMDTLQFGEIIGRGSFAEVHKGKWNEQEVALKRMRLPPGSDTSIVPKEVAVLRDLTHPNIVRLLAYSMSEAEVVLVMNFVQGTDLERVLFSKKDAKELSIDQSLSMAVQITDAVHYMHCHNPVIIHQDLKPHNILVTSSLEKVYVCDMGIAKVKQAAEATVTSVNKGPGTFPYMAPEMFKSSRRGPAVDIYSLGCLFIELFGRKRVWPDLDATAIMMKVVGSYDTPPEMPDTSHLSHPFNGFCSKLCQIDASKRPNIQEVLRMIKDIHSK